MAVYVCKLQLWGKDGVDGNRKRFVFVFSVLPGTDEGATVAGNEPHILRVHVCVDPTILQEAHWARLEHRELLAQVFSYVKDRLEQLGQTEQEELRFIIDEYTESGRFLKQLPTTLEGEFHPDFAVQRDLQGGRTGPN